MKKVMKGPRPLPLILFIEFLDRQGVCNSFKESFGRSNSKSFLSYLFDTKPKDFIARAFDWSSDPKGLYYWSNLNSEWNRVLELFRF